MPYYFGFDATYLLIIVGAVICLIASARLKTTYAKYAKVYARSGMTGAEAAERILKYSGIYDVKIEPVAGDIPTSSICVIAGVEKPQCCPRKLCVPCVFHVDSDRACV